MDISKKRLDEIIRGVFEGTITPTELPRDLFEGILERLSDAVVKGFGVVDDFDEVANLLDHFSHNIGVFSAAKTHQQVVDMSLAMIGEDGLKVSFSQYKRKAEEIFDTYNVNWLKTEYRTAFNNAAGARQWLDIEKDREILPILRYETAGDERVREDHEGLDGITAHVDAQIWQTHFPPNGWNCRCDVTQHEEGEVEITPSQTLSELPDNGVLFNFNPGRDKMIFNNEAHPYGKVDERYRYEGQANFGLPVPPKPKAKPEVAPAKKGFEPENLKEVAGGIREIPASFWSLYKRKPLLTTKSGRREGGSYGEVDGSGFNIDMRPGEEKYYPKGSENMRELIIHEAAHNIHDQHRIFTARASEGPGWPEFNEPYLRARKMFKGKGSEDIVKRAGIFNKFHDSEFRPELNKLFESIGVDPNSKEAEIIFVSAANVIASLTNARLGFGHSKSYFAGNNMYYGKAEFFAHSLEYEFARENIILKTYFPEVVKEMKAATRATLNRIQGE